MKNKKIFITGGQGFIANTLIKHLIEDNNIIVYDNFHRDTITNSGYSNHKNINIIKGDVLDLDFMKSSMKGAEVVIHAAGIASIDTVIKFPVNTMRVNMIGTANMLESAHVNSVKKVIDFSTSEIFGSMAFKSRESDQAVSGSARIEARWTYAVSKLAGEHLAHAYYNQYNLPNNNSEAI